MLSIMNVLQNDKYTPRFYVAGATDNMSLKKARVLEESLMQQGEVHTVSHTITNLKSFVFQLLQYINILPQMEAFHTLS